MAMTIFLILNGLGVIFLLYALANFWRDGRRPKDIARKYTRKFSRRDWGDVTVVTHPISSTAPGGLPVISFQARGQKHGANVSHREAAVIEMPLRKIFTSNRRAGMEEYDSSKAMKKGRQC
jgi:hypothetical protein